MKPNKSAQSRALRRRYTVHFLLTLLAYTAVFCSAMVILNITIVPKIADWIFETTSDDVYIDPANYLEEFSTEELLIDLLESYKDNGTRYTLLWAAPEYQELLSEAGIQTDDPQRERDADLEFSIDDQYPNNLVGEVRLSSMGFGSNAYETTVIELTPMYLAYSMATREAQAIEDRGGNWKWEQLSTKEETPFHPFILRNTTFYNTARTLKIPCAILLYLLGCLVISLMEVRRALSYFDELSSAVVSLITDKLKPIRLTKDLSIAQDELNHIREESAASERAAEAAQKRNNELVAYLAHDIRTPLTSVIGFLSMVNGDERMPKDLQRFVYLASQKADSLQLLVDEFFDITRFNAQSISIERSQVGVMFLLQQLADEFYPQAKESNVKIVVTAPEEGKFCVDGEKLARALGNILKNALAYAASGTKLTIAARSTQEHWVITITNQGSEIPTENIERIFEKFYRDDDARNTKAGGAGLGLAIAKEIVLAHKGAISAVSEHGTTSFVVELPINE